MPDLTMEADITPEDEALLMKAFSEYVAEPTTQWVVVDTQGFAVTTPENTSLSTDC